MTKYDIIRMAREAGMEFQGGFVRIVECVTQPELERFAAIVAAAEREACAKLCEPKRPRPCDCDHCDCGNSGDRAAVVDWDVSNALAVAIRARGNT